MATVTLEKVVEDVKSLTPDEQRQLREMLNSLPDSENPDEELRRREEEFEQRLREKGLLVTLPLPATKSLSFDEYKPVEIKGKPLSETIIEERR